MMRRLGGAEITAGFEQQDPECRILGSGRRRGRAGEPPPMMM